MAAPIAKAGKKRPASGGNDGGKSANKTKEAASAKASPHVKYEKQSKLDWRLGAKQASTTRKTAATPVAAIADVAVHGYATKRAASTAEKSIHR